MLIALCTKAVPLFILDRIMGYSIACWVMVEVSKPLKVTMAASNGSSLSDSQLESVCLCFKKLRTHPLYPKRSFTFPKMPRVAWSKVWKSASGLALGDKNHAHFSWPSPCARGYINAALARVAKKATNEFRVTSPSGRAGGELPAERASSTTTTLFTVSMGIAQGRPLSPEARLTRKRHIAEKQR